MKQEYEYFDVDVMALKCHCRDVPLFVGADETGILTVFCPVCGESRPALEWLAVVQEKFQQIARARRQ